MRVAPALRRTRLQREQCPPTGRRRWAGTSSLIRHGGNHAATVVPVVHACTATVLGVTQTVGKNDNVDVTAPASVPSGGWFVVTLAPEPEMAPGNMGMFTVVDIRNVTQRITLVNATLKGLTLSGGSANVGTTSVTISGSVISVTVSGPIPGGASFTLPALALSLTAGVAGMPALVELTGHDLTFTTVVRSGTFAINAPTSCVPVPDPTILSSTDVT